MAADQLKILIVEDDAVDRAIWKKHLSHPGNTFHCRETESGEEGLERCAEFQPDCILLDFSLPDITGVEFMRRLGGTHRCAIVVATAYGNEDVAVSSMKMGATDYLVKGSVTGEILRHTIEGAVEKVRLRQEVERRGIELEQRNVELEGNQRQVCAAMEAECRPRLAAEESESRYRNLTDAIPHVVWSGTGPCKFENVNRRWNEVTGATAHAAAGDGWLAYVHADDKARIAQMWEESARTMREFEVRFRLMTAYASWRWQSIRGVPYPVPNQVEAKWYGTLTDIEERVRAEQTLNQREKLARSILEQAAEAIVVVDPDGRITRASRAAERLAGAPVEQRRFDEMFPVSLDTGAGYSFRQILSHAGRNHGIHNVEVTMLAPDGRLVTLLLGAAALSGPASELLGCIVNLSDITERKRIQQQRLELLAQERLLATERALRETEAELARVTRGLLVSELTTSLAHEVNQPLTGVIANSGAALRWLDGKAPNVDEVRACLALIERDGKRAADIVGRIREFHEEGE